MGQNITETRWYFGDSQENLIFDANGRGVNLETTQAVPFGNVGAVTITDQFTGNLLFYSDGSQVYDASHTLIPAAVALVGDPTINVPVVTAPVAGSPGQYYLITNPGAVGSTISFSIVDATLEGNGSAQFPLGDLSTANQPIVGLDDPSEAMLIIPVGDGEVFWLITQNQTTFEVSVTEINETGFGTPTNFDFVDGTTPGFAASHFAFNPDSAWLAMAPQTANRNIWLMNFDNATGDLQFEGQLVGTGFDDGAGEAVYDLEWSPDGSKLYYSRFGGATDVANIYQLNFNDTTINPILENDIARSHGLQRAIDDRIYHLYQETLTSPFSLGRINRPDSLPDSVRYEPLVFDVDFNSQQFPSFTPAYNFEFDTLNFYYIDSCFENVTKFFPIVEPVPQNLSWDFGDGGTFEGSIPIYTYQAEGAYTVSLTAEVNGITETVTQFVEIFANDLQVDLGNDTTICVDEILTLDAGTGSSYVWNTGDITQTIDVDTAGTYWVEVTNAIGCTDFDDIVVTEYGVTSQLSNQWYFGVQAGIEFTGGAAAITDGNNQMADEGCATISDINGDLLFYTNGVTIFNREHDVMINGEFIGGDLASAQNSMILPFSGDQTMFYVFTTEDVYGDGEYSLRYTIVDMKEDEGRGAVVVKNIKLMENSTERITASGFTGNDAMLAHEFGNNSFRVYNTTAEGLSGAIFSPVGEVHEFVNELSATGYIKFSPTLDVLAVNIPGTNQVEVFDFDIAAGEVSNPRLIDTGEANLYGLEFSGSGNRLYLTTTGANSKLIQYDLDSLNSANPAADIEATKFDGYTQGTNYGALQTGPDGVIYMAVDNSGTLGTITGADGDDDQASFNNTGFDLLGRTSRLGLPNFAQNQGASPQTPSMTVTAGCLGQPSIFTGSGRDNSIEEYLWAFGDGQSSTDQTTEHTYANPGTYSVTLTLSNRCDVDTILTDIIEIFAIPQEPTVPADTAICDDPIVLTAWPDDDPNLGYFWSTGDTTRQITVSEPADITIAIVDLTTGCSSDTARVLLGNAGPEIDLGPDLVLCQNDVVSLDSEIPNASYTWTIDGIVEGSNRTLNVVTTVAGTFEYAVEVTNSFGCVGRDTLLVTVNEAPAISTTTAETSGCGNVDGDIIVDFNSSGSFTYQITGPVTIGPNSVDGPTTESLLGQFSAGNYTLVVTNIITGCSVTNVAQVSDPGSFNFLPTSTGNCEGGVEITLNSTPANFNFSILFEDGTEAVPAGSNETVFSELDPGTYSIVVEDLDPPGCIEAEQITIIAGPEPNFTFDAIQEICGLSGEILVTDGSGGIVAYSWVGPGGFSDTLSASVTVSQAGIYTVTASDGEVAFCDRSEDIEVIFNEDPQVDVAISGDPCEGEVILIANPTNGSGSFVFNWSDGSQVQENTVTTSGDYAVMIVDQLTSCEASSDTVTVIVEDEFEVILSVEPDCENNGNVFIIATTNYFDPGITYEWQNEAGEVLAGTDSVLAVTVSDTYTVIVTNESGTCTTSGQVDVAVVPIEDEDLILPERATFCPISSDNTLAELDAGIWNTYEWRLLPDEQILSTDQVFSTSAAGTYEVTIFNGFSCSTDTVLVEEDCRPIIFAPNAFSPNGNGENEEFFAFPNDYVDQFEIFIYTRWGEIIYYSNNKDFRWDGTYRGRLISVGTYAYIMKFTSLLEPELGTVEQYGSVTLIR